MAQIRPHTLDDADAIADILADGWRAAYSDFMPADILAPRADRAARRVEIREFLAAEFDPQTERLLVFEDESVDGFVHIVLEGKADLGASAHINLLYVTPTKFGRGIGRRLMVAAAEWLEGRIAGPVVLSAYALNPYAAFYAHIGGMAVKTAQVQFGGQDLGVVYYQWASAASLRAGASSVTQM